MTNDLVSDMLTRIRNASLARHSFTAIRYNKINLGILKILKSEGYIQDYLLENEESISKVQIKVLLKYKGWWIKKPLFSTIQRISKPGKRVFSGYKNFETTIDVLKYHQGVAIVSTSSGIMGHLKATKLRKGGEILCYVG
jgi:small subunit ribosomal protein S8